VNYVGIDSAYRRAAWCGLRRGRADRGRGADFPPRPTISRCGCSGSAPKRRVAFEEMSGAVWVKEQLELAAW
jgi:hypothetical protein